MRQLVIPICIVGLLSLCGCMATVAALSYPTAPSTPQDSYVELSFVYVDNKIDIPISFVSKYSYSKKWAANTGWSITGGPTAWRVVRKLENNRFLFFTMPSGPSIDPHSSCIAEFDLSQERPYPTIISSAVYTDCRPLEQISRVRNYKAKTISENFANVHMTLEEQRVLDIINKYEYIVLPIRVIEESAWKAYPKLYEIFGNANKIITSQTFHKEQKNNISYRDLIFNRVEFPYGHALHYKAESKTIFATAGKNGWVLDSVKFDQNNCIRVYKRFDANSSSNDPIWDILTYKNKESIPLDFLQIYDPSTRSILSIKRTTNALY